MDENENGIPEEINDLKNRFSKVLLYIEKQYSVAINAFNINVMTKNWLFANEDLKYRAANNYFYKISDNDEVFKCFVSDVSDFRNFYTMIVNKVNSIEKSRLLLIKREIDFYETNEKILSDDDRMIIVDDSLKK